MSAFRELYKAKADEFGLDPILVQAIAIQESGERPFVTRYEPQYRWTFSVDTLADNLGISRLTMEMSQKFSYGLLQILGACAYERGFRGYPVELATPENSVHWGCAHLAWMIRSKHLADESEYIACYNAGNVLRTPGGNFSNFRYVDSVSRILRNLRSEGLS